MASLDSNSGRQGNGDTPLNPYLLPKEFTPVLPEKLPGAPLPNLYEAQKDIQAPLLPTTKNEPSAVHLTGDRLLQGLGAGYAYSQLRGLPMESVIAAPDHKGLKEQIPAFREANSQYSDLLATRQKRQFNEVAKMARAYDMKVDAASLLTEPVRNDFAQKATPKEVAALDRYLRFDGERSMVSALNQKFSGENLGYVHRQDTLPPAAVSPSEFRGANKTIAETYAARSAALNGEVNSALSLQEQLMKRAYLSNVGMMAGGFAVNYLADNTLFSGVTASVRTMAADLALPLVAAVPRLNLVIKGATIVGGHLLAMKWDQLDQQKPG